MAEKKIELIIVGKNQASPALDDVEDSLGGVEQAANKAGKGLDRAGDAADGAGSKAKGASSKVEDLAKEFATLGGVMAAVETAKGVLDFTRQGASVLGVANSFEGLTKNAGLSADMYLGKLKTATNGYVDDMQLMTISNKVLLNGSTDLANKLPRLLEIAGASARATGGDYKQLSADMIEGITKAEPEILDNLGFAINLTKVYDEYAASVGKTAAALTQQEKQTALLNEVLRQGDGYIAKIGTTGDAAGASMERLVTRFTNLKNEIAGLSAIGLEEFLSGGDFSSNEANRMAIEAGASYEKYTEALTKADMASDIMSESQYALATALHANGTSAYDAGVAAKSLADTEQILRDAFFRGTEAASLNEQQQEALVAKALELSAINPEVANTVYEAVSAFNDQAISLEELESALVGVETNLQYADIEQARLAQSSMLAASEARNHEAAMQEFLPTIYAVTEAQIADMQSKFDTAYAAENLAAFNEDLANTASLVANGSWDAAASEAVLAQRYGITVGQVRTLISAMNQLNLARAGKAGVTLGEDIGASLSNLTRGISDGSVAESIARQTKKKGRAGGGGGGKSAGGKSEAVKQAEKDAKELEKIDKKLAEAKEKYLEKKEQLEREHAAKVLEINKKAAEERLKAEQQLQQKQFDSRADYYTWVAGLDQQYRSGAIARYEEIWATQAKMVAEGKIKEAEAYRKAAEEAVKADIEREQAMAEIRAQMADETAQLTQKERDDLAERLRLLEYADRLADDQAAAELERLKNSADSIEQTRQDELAKEQEDYQEAGSELRADFDETVADIRESAGEIGDAVNNMADTVVADLDRIVGAANAAAGAVEGAAGAGGTGPDATVLQVPSYRTGTGSGGLQGDGLVYAHDGEIIATPSESNAIRRNGGLDSVLAASELLRSGGGSTTSGSNAPTINLYPTFATGTPTQEISRASSQLKTLVDEAVKKAMKEKAAEDRGYKIMRG